MLFLIQSARFIRLLWNCLGWFGRLREQHELWWHLSDLRNHRANSCPATLVEKSLPCFPLRLRRRVLVTCASTCDRNFPIIQQDKAVSGLAPRAGMELSLSLSEMVHSSFALLLPLTREHTSMSQLCLLGFPRALLSSSQLEVAFAYITDTSWWVVIWFSRDASWECVSGTAYGGGWGRMWSHAWSEKQ